MDVFADNGFHGTSLKEIAARVGIRDSAIYHYFASKEAMLDAILVERSPKAENRQPFDDPDDDPRVALEALGRAIIELMALPHTEKIFRVLMADGLRLHVEKRVNLLRYFEGTKFAKLLERWMSAKTIRPGRPELLAIEFIAPFHMLMMLRMLQPEHPLTRDPDSFVRGHVEHFLNGVSHRQ